MKNSPRIALTGFMGVGKSSVARHLKHFCGGKRVDLDAVIEETEHRSIASIIDNDGENAYRLIETRNLENVLNDGLATILSLGGGTWTIERNRELIRRHGFTSVWLEAAFEHCWLNIAFSRKDRPLARDKQKARRLFDERQKFYCLADWHFVIRSGSNSYEIARQIKEQLFS